MTGRVALAGCRIDAAVRIRRVTVAAVDTLTEAIAAQFDRDLAVRRVAHAVAGNNAAIGIVTITPADALAKATHWAL